MQKFDEHQQENTIGSEHVSMCTPDDAYRMLDNVQDQGGEHFFTAR